MSQRALRMYRSARHEIDYEDKPSVVAVDKALGGGVPVPAKK